MDHDVSRRVPDRAEPNGVGMDRFRDAQRPRGLAPIPVRRTASWQGPGTGSGATYPQPRGPDPEGARETPSPCRPEMGPGHDLVLDGRFDVRDWLPAHVRDVGHLGAPPAII